MTDICSVCGEIREEHAVLNHEFNLNGELVPKTRSTSARGQQTIPTVIGAIDIELRRILLEKGIISDADFAALRNSGASAPGDREAGEASGSQRGLRNSSRYSQE